MAKNIEDKIDLSKISNLDAVKKFDENFRKIETNSFFPTEKVRIPLPSKGKPYLTITEDPDILDGFIVIREMKGHDEKILSTPSFIKDGSIFRRILDNCIISDIKSDQLITSDFNYVLFSLRGISYGDIYKFKHKCNNSICEKEFTVEANMGEIEWEELPEDFQEPIRIKLPKSGYTVECILPRQYHVEMLKKDDMVSKKEYDSGRAMIKKYVYTTTSIKDLDGMLIPEGKDKSNWEKFFSDLSVRDLAELREKTNFISNIENKEVICPYCGNTQKAPIPVSTEFFRL